MRPKWDVACHVGWNLMFDWKIDWCAYYQEKSSTTDLGKYTPCGHSRKTQKNTTFFSFPIEKATEIDTDGNGLKKD